MKIAIIYYPGITEHKESFDAIREIYDLNRLMFWNAKKNLSEYDAIGFASESISTTSTNPYFSPNPTYPKTKVF